MITFTRSWRGVTLALPLTALALSTDTSSAALVDGLTAYWNLDNNPTDQAQGLAGSASAVADDLAYASGHAGVYGPGLFGGGGYLGSGPGTGHAEAPDSNDINGTGDNISVSWWGRTTGFTAGWQAGVAKGEGNNWRFHRQDGNNTIAWQGGGGDIAGTVDVNDQQWHHFVGTKDAVNGRVLYVDGVQVATGAAGTAINIDPGLPLMIGENPQANNREWAGDIDDVAIWNRALTQAEVTEIFTEGDSNGNALGALLNIAPPGDTDGDGLLDAWEIANLPAGAELDDGTTNPDFGAAGDPDNDMSDNAEEQDRGTDPQDDDSDDDGLKDGVEDNGDVFVSATQTGTDPLDDDSDDDTLLDGVEDNGGIFVDLTMTGTDPNNADSDNDGADDGFEANDPGRDPNVADGGGGPTTLGDGLTAYWALDGNGTDSASNFAGNADTVADDVAAASGHPGTYGPGLFGSGGYLGSGPGTGHFETPHSDDVAGTGDNITVSWWGRTTGFTAGWQAGVAKGEGNNWRFHRQGGNNTIAWQGGGGDIAGTVDVNDQQWHHFVGTKDAVNGRVLYVDGVQVATGPAGTAINIDAALPMMIGENPQANNREWAGDIDDVAIWNRALSSDEVTELFTAGDGGSSLGDILVPPTDTDGDMLPDAYELGFAAVTDLNDLSGIAWDGVGATPGPGAGTGDFDGDGRSDKQEFEDGTDPTNADSDDDGLLDGVETNTGIFNSASDTGTDPNNPDSDGDGTDDGTEVADPSRNPNVADAPMPDGLEAGLTAYYNFDGNSLDQAHLLPASASTVADDLAPASGHPGTYGPGLFGEGGYLGLGPSLGHFEAPHSDDVAGTGDNITVSWWGRVESFTAGWQAGVAKGEGNNWRFHRQGGNNTIAWQGGGGDIAGTVNVNDQQWHHFVGTKDAANGRVLYVDGVEVATGPAGTPINVDPGLPLMIGENPQANNREWAGDIDDVAIWNRALSADEVTGLHAAGLAGESLGDLLGGPSLSALGLAVANVGGQLEISWDSIAGNVYDLLSELPDNITLANGPEIWGTFGANVAIPATPPRNTLTIDFPADLERYFAIRQYPTPPTKVYSDDFEGGQGSWTATTDADKSATVWEPGIPDSNVPGGPAAAKSGSNCFGTDLDSTYLDSTLTRLRSPAIDTTGIAAGNLVYWRWTDIEPTFDRGRIRVLDASNDSEIAVIEDAIEGTSSAWEEVSIPLPAEAIGKSIIIEFVLETDTFNTTPQAGFYIDDVCVEGNPL